MPDPVAPTTTGLPPNNVFGDDASSISISMQTNFQQVAQELQVVSQLQGDWRKNAEVMANALGLAQERMEGLVAASKEDAKIQQELIAARKTLQELSDRSTSNSREETANAEKLVTLAEALSKLSGGKFKVDIPQVPDLMQHAAMQRFHLDSLADAFSTPSTAAIGHGVSDAKSDLDAGRLGEGILSIRRALQALDSDNIKLTREQIKAKTELLKLSEQLNVEAQAAEAGTGDPSTHAQSFRSGLIKRLERYNPDFFGEKAVQNSRQRLMRTVPQHLPGGSEGPLGQAFRTLTPELLEGLGSTVVPIAAAGAALKVGYDQYVNMSNQRRELTGLQGQTSMGDTVGYDMKARMMAISPFVSDRQAREIIQASLREGYKGDTADNAIDFAVDNFKKFNMSVGESMAIYRANVIEAGASTEKVANQLAGLSREAAHSVNSLEDTNKAFASNSQMLAGMGAGVATPQISSALATAVDRTPELHGVNLGQMLNNQQFQTVFATTLGTDVVHLPAALRQMQNDPSKTVQSYYSTLRQILVGAGYPVGSTSDQLYQNAPLLLQLLKTYGAPIDTPAQAVALAEQALSNEGGGIFGQQLARSEQVNKPHQIGTAERAGSYLTTVGKGLNAHDPFSSAKQRTRGDIEETYYSQVVAGRGEEMPVVMDFLKQGNPRDEAVQYKGQTMPLQDFVNKYGYEGFQALQTGEATVAKVKGGFKNGKPRNAVAADAWQSVAQFTGEGTYALAQQAVGGAGSAAAYQHELHLSDDAKKLVKIMDNGVYNSLIDQAAKSGQGSNMNDKTGG